MPCPTRCCRPFAWLPVAYAIAFLAWPVVGRAAEPLPGTAALDWEGDLADRMVAGIDTFLLREIDESVARRAAYWPG